MSKIIKLLTSSHPIVFTIAFMLVFSTIVFYVDKQIVEKKMEAQLDILSKNIEEYIIEELHRIPETLLIDSLVQYRFIDTTYTINMLGVNTKDSSAIVKDYMAGYIKVRYSDLPKDTGKIDKSKMYLGEKEGIKYEEQVHKNPNNITIPPHFLITQHRDSLGIANNIMDLMNDNIEVFRQFNEEAIGKRRKLYLDINDFGTDKLYIPIVLPSMSTKTQTNEKGENVYISYMALLRYALCPLDYFIDNLLKYNIDVTIKNGVNNVYIYGDSLKEYKLSNSVYGHKILVDFDRGNNFLVTFACNDDFPREWTFFPTVYILLVVISALFYITLTVFLNSIRHKENELQVANTNLEIANNTKDKFFSIISHDLKNSIASLSNVATVFEEYYYKMTPEEVSKNIKILVNATSHTGKMLENLLHWSRVNMGSIRFYPQKAEVDSVINTAFDDVGIQAENKNIELISKNNTDGYVYCDIDMVNIVLRNLISNAIKFSDKGKKISVLVDNYVDENYIMVTVKDEGTGMPPDIINKLFKLESKISKKGTAGETGTGLGLTLCKELIDKHDCSIWAESEVGKGTEFKFTILKCNNFSILKYKTQADSIEI